MIRLPLGLSRSPLPVHAPAAWFIAGGDAAIWLDELSRWNVPLAKVKLFVLPASPTNPQATGVLVTLDNVRPHETLRAEAYGCVANRVYLPLHARFEPAVTDAELAELAPFELSVFHPAAGLVGFQAADGISVASLLELPPRRDALWDRAQPGASPYPRLVSVEPDVLISLDDLMQAGRGDIGSKPPDKLPPHKGEMNPALGKAMIAGLGAAGAVAGALGGIASGIGGVLGGLGLGGLFGGGAGGGAGSGAKSGGGKKGAASGGGGRGLFDGFKEWARAHVERWSEQLERARTRELDRLLRMLDDDPDMGLSYAIPIAGKEGQARGTGNPGANLVRRGTNFDLGSLRGGGPVDPWSMPDKIRMELRQKYLKAANRELQLGRFRRAAYIFSELLGDHNAAANALKQGRFFREAAVIYRDVLKNKELAAECLEEGGLITEAIALREELKQWLHAARLYEKIERPDDARLNYRKAATEARDRMDYVAAARILHESMAEHDEALAVLGQGWPDSPQAESCLTAQFGLLGKLGRHGAAVKVVQCLRATKLPDWQTQTAVEICSKQSTVYPDAAFRVKSADVTRVLAGRLMAKSIDRVRPLTVAVAALAPEDRLLARDTTRYIEHRLKQERKVKQSAPVVPPTRDSQKISGSRRLVRIIQLGHDGEKWSAAAIGGNTFYAAAAMTFEDERPGLLVVRGLWTGELQRECWANAPALKSDTLILDAPHLDNQDVVVGPLKGKGIAMREMPGGRVGAKVRVGTPGWVPADTVAFSYDELGHSLVLSFQNDGVVELAEGKLEIFDQKQQLKKQFTLELLPTEHVLMAARVGRVFVSNGASGLISIHNDRVDVEDLGQPIRSIVASAPFTRLRVAIALEEGGIVIWPDTATQKQKQVRFGQGMFAPVIGFTRGGDLVAVTKSEVRIYHTESETLVIACSVAGPGEEPYAVLPAEGVDEYAVFLKNGDVQVWRV